MLLIRNIFETMILNLDYTFEIKSVDPITDGFRLLTCDTLNLATGKVVTIDGIEYKIIDFQINDYIDVEGVDPITATSFEVEPLHFNWGTLLDTNHERRSGDVLREEQTPFFWLRTPFEYEKGNFESAYDLTAEVTFYLMDEVFYIGESLSPVDPVWYTKVHEERVIEPLRNLLENRIEKYIETNQNIFMDLPNYNVRELVLAGTEDSSGSRSILFDEKLSGLEVRIQLEFFENVNCNC